MAVVLASKLDGRMGNTRLCGITVAEAVGATVTVSTKADNAMATTNTLPTAKEAEVSCVSTSRERTGAWSRSRWGCMVTEQRMSKCGGV